jgi:hypothetical protein
VPQQIYQQRLSFSLQRMLNLEHALLTAAEGLRIVGPPSPLMKSLNVGTWGNVSDKPPATACAIEAA